MSPPRGDDTQISTGMKIKAKDQEGGLSAGVKIRQMIHVDFDRASALAYDLWETNENYKKVEQTIGAVMCLQKWARKAIHRTVGLDHTLPMAAELEDNNGDTLPEIEHTHLLDDVDDSKHPTGGEEDAGQGMEDESKAVAEMLHVSPPPMTYRLLRS